MWHGQVRSGGGFARAGGTKRKEHHERLNGYSTFLDTRSEPGWGQPGSAPCVAQCASRPHALRSSLLAPRSSPLPPLPSSPPLCYISQPVH